jgi:hypothetical protein
VKGILEASEGIAALFAERGGDLTLVAPRDRAAELEALLLDLGRDIGAVIADTEGEAPCAEEAPRLRRGGESAGRGELEAGD